jgi:uncharacterized protein DUF6912
MRIYLPATLPRLAAGLAAGQFDPDVAYAVTPALREWYAEGDIEELEYVAAAAAARASLQMLGEETAIEAAAGADAAEDASQVGRLLPARRVVLAADVPDSLVRPAPDLGRAAVRPGAPVAMSQVVSALVDDADASVDVRRAVVALRPADAGDEDARFVVDSVEDHELAWYAAQELGGLVELET